MKRTCDNCCKEYDADPRNSKRGWGKCCSKRCAAKLRERNKPSYNPKRVSCNNMRRENWNDYPTHYERYPLSYDEADNDQWGDCEFGIHD
jgi:hypothetical protein